MNKKILTILLVLSLALSTMSTVYADNAKPTEKKAEVLFQLGLFKGVDPVVFTPNLEGATDRAAAMVMVGRALNWVHTEEWDEDAVSGFVDVPDWAESFVAYAVKKEITLGIGGNLFGNNLDVTERQLQTWFDRALGKGDTWVNNEILDNQVGLIRSNLVESTWNALMQIPVGGDKTLIVTIIGDNNYMLELALNEGLILKEDISPEKYIVTVDDVNQHYYNAGQELEFTVRGLEPNTNIEIAIRLFTGGPGYPYYDGEVLVGISEFDGLVDNEGRVTFSGELREGLPEGDLVIIPAGYGYSIDNPINLEHSGMIARTGTNVKVHPEDYTVVVDDTEKIAYKGSEQLTFTVRGLEPNSNVLISVLIQTGGPGYPFYDGEVLVGMRALVGAVGSDGSVTISRPLHGTLPEGTLVIIPSGYGYSIDNPITLNHDGGDVMFIKPPVSVTINNGEPVTISVFEGIPLGGVLMVLNSLGREALFVSGAWHSSDSSIASVDLMNGMVEGHKPGTVTIRFMTDNGVTGSIQLTVTE